MINRRIYISMYETKRNEQRRKRRRKGRRDCRNELSMYTIELLSFLINIHFQVN